MVGSAQFYLTWVKLKLQFNLVYNKILLVNNYVIVK